MKYLQDLFITGADRRMVEMGFGEIRPNKLNLSEGQRNKEIVEKISKICVLGQYPTNETNRHNWEVWYLNNPTCVHCTLTFNKELPLQRINEIMGYMEQICGETGRETWIDYIVVYNQAKLNEVAYNFIQDMQDQIIMYRNKKSHIMLSGYYNDNCVSSFVMPVRNRVNGYRLDNLQTVRLAIENGYLG